MIRNFHVHYVPHPTFQDQEVLQALIVHLSRVRCLFEKKNTKVQVKVYTFEIPMNNVVIRFVWFWEHLLFCLPFWCWYHLKRVVDYNSLIQPSKFCIGKMMLYWPYSLLHAMKILLSSILPSLLKFLPLHINDIHTCFRVRLTVILGSVSIIYNTWKVLFFKY